MSRDEYVRCPVCGGDSWRTVINGSGFRIDECVRGCIGRTVPPPDRPVGLPAGVRVEDLAGLDVRKSGHFRIAGEILDLVGRFQPKGRLLDIGCGFGHLLKLAVLRGYAAVGIDACPAAAEFVRAACGIEPVIGQFPGYAFEDCSFDVLAMNHVLEHVPEPAMALSESARILKPGGVLAVCAPNFDSLMRRIRGSGWEGLKPSQHVWQFSVRSLLGLVLAAGLTPVTARCGSLDYPRGPRRLPKWLALRLALTTARLLRMGDNAIVLARRRS